MPRAAARVPKRGAASAAASAVPSVAASAAVPLDARLKAALAALERRGTKAGREGMARYGLAARKVFGVSVKEIQAIAKATGRDHALAQALFASGWYEARLLAAFVEDPAVISKAEMAAWARGFENWGDCDTAVMHCFDRSPHAWAMTARWLKAKPEFERRTGFVMLASMALHHKAAPSAPFVAALRDVERGADDERHFVKKAVNWALRSIGSRDAACHAAAMTLAARLAAREEPGARWIGKDALRQLSTPATKARLARAARAARTTRRA
jgi:3-methyladenine DNA glycosylase AlkD